MTSTARSSVERATPGAAVLIARTGAVVGLGLIVVLVLLLSWAGTVRRLTDELTRPAPIRRLRRRTLRPRPGDRASAGG